MSLVLADSSVWIDFFRGSKNIEVELFNELVDDNRICTNDLILSELLPSVIYKKESELAGLLRQVRKIPVKIIWDEIIHYQTLNLANGLINIGIPDLIIMQNVIQNDLTLYSTDKHFLHLKKIHKFKTLQSM